MSTQLQITTMLSSIAFICLVGCGFIVILTVPSLSREPIYPMLIVAGISLIIAPIISWVVAAKIQKLK